MPDAQKKGVLQIEEHLFILNPKVIEEY